MPHVNSNQKSWLLLVLLSLTFMSLGFLLGERQGLLLGFILSLLINAFSYFYAEYRWLGRFDRTEVLGQDPWGLNEMVREFSTHYRVARPRIFLLPFSTPTAFSLGRNRSYPSIFLTQGLVDRFSAEELRAVLALEMAHIQRLDTLAFSVAAALADLIMLPALALDWIVQLGNRARSDHPSDPQFFKSLATPFAAAPIFFIIGRNSYFDVDRRAAQALRNPEVIARVLWKLDSFSRTRPLLDPTYFTGAHMHIVNPLTSQKANRYFHRHPPVESRIIQLIGRYPI